MRVAERLARRESNWRELDQLLLKFERTGALKQRRPSARGGQLGPDEVIRLGELYRSACADLMLAEAHDLPGNTISYLHALVGRAHNTLYRSQGFRFKTWFQMVADVVPRRLRRDRALRIAALLFFGSFLIAGAIAAGQQGFASDLVGPEQIDMLEAMYAEPVYLEGLSSQRSDALMTGFYINHNAGIGLKCYAYGLSFGILTVFELYSQGTALGAMFGHMAVTDSARNFYHFVTAHAPVELMAIVLAGAAGLRLGWGLIAPKGRRRIDSLRAEARESLPIAGASVCLFVIAAFIEGFVSASALPYEIKAVVALLSAIGIAAYLVLGGRSGASELANPTPRTTPHRPLIGA